MATEGKKKTGGGKLTRSETVTVRLEPKLRYLAEIAGRKQRRTLSSFIEWAVQLGLTESILEEGSYNHGKGTSVADVASKLWDVDEEDRFVKLALSYDELLTHEEQVLWKLIRENGYVWRGRFSGSGEEQYWVWDVELESLIFDRLKKHWSDFVEVARGNKEKSILPGWMKARKTPPKTGTFGEMDDDIPF